MEQAEEATLLAETAPYVAEDGAAEPPKDIEYVMRQLATAPPPSVAV